MLNFYYIIILVLLVHVATEKCPVHFIKDVIFSILESWSARHYFDVCFKALLFDTFLVE
jgi:hypothetical protein